MIEFAIIGLGSWGLCVLERTVSRARMTTATVRVHVIQPGPPGGGVYSLDQPDYLVLNNACGQLSLYASPDGVTEPLSAALEQLVGLILRRLLGGGVGLGVVADVGERDARAGVAEDATERECVGVVLGTLVGIPVCAVRKPIAEEKYGIAQMSGEHNQLRVKIPAAIFYLPIAVATGVFEAPYWAVGNSVIYSDQPFSKDQFSLGDMETAKAQHQGNTAR